MNNLSEQSLTDLRERIRDFIYACTNWKMSSDQADFIIGLVRASISSTPATTDEVERVVAAIDAEANKRPTGEGLVYSYGEVERGIRAALASAPAIDEVERLKKALVQAAIPLEGLLLCKSVNAVSLAPGTWAEIENGVKHIRAALNQGDSSDAG